MCLISVTNVFVLESFAAAKRHFIMVMSLDKKLCHEEHTTVNSLLQKYQLWNYMVVDFILHMGH